VKVRLMHAQVRRMLMKSERWKSAQWGLPITQHDMARTTLLFSLSVLEGLRAFGVKCEELDDGMVIEGTDAPLTPTEVASKGDHRIAMSAAVLALLGSGPSKITDADCIATSFPKFVGTLRALGARIDVQ
jgi:hypothetical protein